MNLCRYILIRWFRGPSNRYAYQVCLCRLTHQLKAKTRSQSTSSIWAVKSPSLINFMRPKLHGFLEVSYPIEGIACNISYRNTR